MRSLLNSYYIVYHSCLDPSDWNCEAKNWKNKTRVWYNTLTCLIGMIGGATMTFSSRVLRLVPKVLSTFLTVFLKAYIRLTYTFCIICSITASVNVYILYRKIHEKNGRLILYWIPLTKIHCLCWCREGFDDKKFKWDH